MKAETLQEKEYEVNAMFLVTISEELRDKLTANHCRLLTEKFDIKGNVMWVFDIHDGKPVDIDYAAHKGQFFTVDKIRFDFDSM